MDARSVCTALAIISLLPSTARCFNLVDIGLVNDTSRLLKLMIEYNNGRRIDWTLAPRKSILMTRGLGEHITRVTVAGGRQTYDVAALRRSSLGKRRDLWLSFSADRIRVITDDEKRALENAQLTPNQSLEPTTGRCVASLQMILTHPTQAKLALASAGSAQAR